MYCICCKQNNVKPYVPHLVGREGKFDLTEEEILWGKEKRNRLTLNINNQMVNNGIIHIIEAGYGSKHDGDQLIIAICDDCINENLEDGTLLYYDSSGSFYPDMIKEDIEKSKKAYRRRKNLDGLV